MIYSSIEALESRIAPAGLITAKLAGGSLFISGDGEDNEVTFTQVNAHTFVLSSSTGNIELDLPGSDDPAPASNITFTGFKGNLVVDLGEGNDTVNIASLFTGKNLTIDAGAGTNSISLNYVQLSGNVQINGGDGGNSLGIGTLKIKGNLKSSFGDGNDTVTTSFVEAKGVSANLGGGNDSFAFQNGTVRGAFSVNAGNGANQVTIGSTALEIRGKLSVIHGDDALNDATVVQGAQAKLGSVFVQNGNGGSATAFSVGFLEAGPVRILNGSGNDAVTLSGSSFALKSIFVEGGEGDDNLQVSTGGLSVTGNVVFKGSNGNDVAFIVGSGAVGGAVTLDLGAGTAAQTAQVLGGPIFNIAKTLTVKSASTNSAHVTLVNAAVNGGVKLDLSQGNNNVTIVGSSIRGAFDAKLGDGQDTVGIEDSLFNGLFSLVTNGGADMVTIETSGSFESRFNKAVKINLGAGNDSLTVGAGTASTRAVFAKKVTFDGGAGTNTASIDNGNIYPTGQPKLLNFPVL